MPPSDPDLSLVQALQSGEESALNELIAKYQEPLLRFIFRYTNNEATARDLLQQTFVRLYFNIGRFKPSAKFVTWLYSIAANLCRDHVKSRAHRDSQRTFSLSSDAPLDAGIQADVPASERGPAEAAEDHEKLAAVEKAISELPHDLRTALVLFGIEGLPQQECAELLGITAKSVETRVYRARKILMKKLEEFQGG